MAENLGQADQIVAVVGKVLVGHRMPQQVRVHVHAGQMAAYLSTTARMPRSPSGPRSPTKTLLDGIGGRVSR